MAALEAERYLRRNLLRQAPNRRGGGRRGPLVDWDRIRIFSQSPSRQLHASRRRSGLEPIGREPAGLGAERELKAPLFHRHARGLI
jgi:hypothetical protein